MRSRVLEASHGAAPQKQQQQEKAKRCGELLLEDFIEPFRNLKAKSGKSEDDVQQVVFRCACPARFSHSDEHVEAGSPPGDVGCGLRYALN